MTDWTTDDIPDQTGRVILVTGANSGLGLAATRALAAKGAYVLMACRDVEKGRRVREELVPGGDNHSEVRHLDLADLDSVHRFADSISDWRIEAVVNNAGVMNTPLMRTVQGHEIQFGINVLGHFALMQRVWHQVTDRFVWLGSVAHRFGRLADLGDLDWRRRRYNSWRAYGDSKLACIMLAYEQQRIFERNGDHRRALAAHPGVSDTDLFRPHGTGTTLGPLGGKLMRSGRVLQSAEMGALTQLYATTVTDVPGGSYVGPDGPGELGGHPVLVNSSKVSYNAAKGRALWEECERLVAAG